MGICAALWGENCSNAPRRPSLDSQLLERESAGEEEKTEGEDYLLKKSGRK